MRGDLEFKVSRRVQEGFKSSKRVEKFKIISIIELLKAQGLEPLYSEVGKYIHSKKA
jgi:hypothetical protein